MRTAARALILVAFGAGTALADECSVKPESIEATGWRSLRPGMTVTEARAALEADGIVFEETAKPEPSGEPKLTFACSEWRGWVEFENRFPDVEWRVGNIHFTRQTADRQESDRLASEVSAGLGSRKSLHTVRRSLPSRVEMDHFPPLRGFGNCTVLESGREGFEGSHISYAVAVDTRLNGVHVVYAKARSSAADKEN